MDGQPSDCHIILGFYKYISKKALTFREESMSAIPMD